MRIDKIEISNFRKLEQISISLDEAVTLIVGKNNSGKTSLTEVFYNFFYKEKAKFDFDDFSVSTYQRFEEALQLFKEYEQVKSTKDEEKILEKENQLKEVIPKIEVRIFIEYEDSDNLASLSKFIMDLDPNRRDALLSIQYTVTDFESLFKAFKNEGKKFDDNIVKFLKKNHRRFYGEMIYAIDAQDETTYMLIEKKESILNVFGTEFIYAQRFLDDQSSDKQRKLSLAFEDFYRLNKESNEADVNDIEEALLTVSKTLDGKYESFFKSVFGDLKKFGIDSGVSLQELEIKSFFDSEKVLKGNTKFFYKHDEDTLLPENSNGLGFSNLIFMLLQFISFYERFDKRNPRPNFQLIFVEEPEVHLHPQMQYVFIKNIKDFIKEKNGWNAQVVITTHSSHIVSQSGFKNIRYFDNSTPTLTVKNLLEFKNEQDKEAPETIKFLEQYMSLNNCDMFFADKIVLVEGTVERLLLPLIIKNEFKDSLANQYVSLIEVGGAYAHRFREFLDFINVKTLVITDIDSIDTQDKRRACRVSDGDKTSNAVLAKWLPNKENINELIKCSDDEKVNSNIRVAFQIPESGTNKSDCGRSFEEAFILCNAKVLEDCKTGISMPILFGSKKENEIKTSAYDISKEISQNKLKTAFAFDIMLLQNWVTPKYIKDGLTWLK